jgi:cell division protein FtsL
MKDQKNPLSEKLHPFVYVALVLYIGIFLGSAWFSSYQNKISLQMRQEFEQRKSQLLDEIGKLEMEEAGLTSIERIHEIVQALQMVQPTEPVQALQEDADDSSGNNGASADRQ